MREPPVEDTANQLRKAGMMTVDHAICVVREAVTPICRVGGFTFVACLSDGARIRCRFHRPGDSPDDYWSVVVAHNKLTDPRRVTALARRRARRLVDWSIESKRALR